MFFLTKYLRSFFLDEWVKHCALMNKMQKNFRAEIKELRMKIKNKFLRHSVHNFQQKNFYIWFFNLCLKDTG